MFLKLTSLVILQYLWPVDLWKRFSPLILLIFILPQYFLIDFAGKLSEGSTHVANMLVYDKEI